MTALDIKSIRERAEKASGAPWGVWVRTHTREGADIISLGGNNRLVANIPAPPLDCEPRHPADAQELRDSEFIATARTDIPALCSRIEELEAALREITFCHTDIAMHAIARKALG